ncbi:MAG: DUF3262 family protein [Moritella sp.]|uniref:hypothetical protein n=1 Tax=Moritella sp. TaxID=78556 RepID=UPI001DCC019C|nr:hypothetical protein [Moritella sp.]NQZ49367.1 DUF3262 family protein [Moritella sp.]
MACHERGIDYQHCMEVVFNTGGMSDVVDYYTLFQYSGLAILLLFGAWVLGNIYDAFSARKLSFAFAIKAVARVLVLVSFGMYLMTGG